MFKIWRGKKTGKELLSFATCVQATVIVFVMENPIASPYFFFFPLLCYNGFLYNGVFIKHNTCFTRTIYNN